MLFTVEGEELYSHQVLALDGQVKLVKVPITEAYVPNLVLGAISIWAEQAWSDQEELVVPPLKSFLDETRASIAEDHNGDPVFLARNSWHLDRAQQDHPKLKFLKIKEQPH